MHMLAFVGSYGHLNSKYYSSQTLLGYYTLQASYQVLQAASFCMLHDKKLRLAIDIMEGHAQCQKFFTSNSQPLFLSGVHHLHTDRIIENVHNISIISSTANDTTQVSVIQCYPTNNDRAINSTICCVRCSFHKMMHL